MQEAVVKHILPQHTVDTQKTIRQWGYGTHALFLTLREKQFMTLKEIHALCLKQTMEARGIFLSDTLRQTIVNDVWKMFGKTNALYPEVIPMLEDLKKSAYVLGLITDSDSDIVYSIIKKHNLERFFTINIISSELHTYKPDTLPFEKALEQAQCSGKECLYVGDSEIDIKGAKETGLTTVIVQRDELCDPQINCKPDFQIRSLVELPALLEQLAT